MWTRKDLKEAGKESFHKFYWWAVLACFIMTLVGGSQGSGSTFTYRRQYGEKFKDIVQDQNMLMILISTLVGAFIVGIVFTILVRNPFRVGFQKMFIKGRSEEVTISEITYAYNSGSFLNIVKTMFLVDVFTFLWTLLFIIPGIVKAYEYRMIPYILAEHPDMSHEEAFERSKRMMDGQKMNAFILDISFIWWYLLSTITIGIVGLLYVNPYVAATNVELYEVLKQDGE